LIIALEQTNQLLGIFDAKQDQRAGSALLLYPHMAQVLTQREQVDITNRVQLNRDDPLSPTAAQDNNALIGQKVKDSGPLKTRQQRRKTPQKQRHQWEQTNQAGKRNRIMQFAPQPHHGASQHRCPEKQDGKSHQLQPAEGMAARRRLSLPPEFFAGSQQMIPIHRAD
jgi:hypothetical protein